MKKTGLTIAAIILLCAASWHAPNTISAREMDLTGTQWRIVYDDPDGHKDHELLFYPGGRLGFKHPNDTTPDNDFWIQDGTKIILTINSKFVTYTGTLLENRIEGSALNVRNNRWNWVATYVGNIADHDGIKLPGGKDAKDKESIRSTE